MLGPDVLRGFDREEPEHLVVDRERRGVVLVRDDLPEAEVVELFGDHAPLPLYVVIRVGFVLGDLGLVVVEHACDLKRGQGLDVRRLAARAGSQVPSALQSDPAILQAARASGFASFDDVEYRVSEADPTDRTASKLRTAHTIAAAALGAQAVVVGILQGITGARLTLPVTVDFASGSPGSADESARLAITEVDLGAAAVAVLVLAAVASLAAGTIPRGRGSSGSWIVHGVTTPIVVFLIAQLNGVSDIGALVAIYALSGALCLFGILHARSDASASRGMSPLAFGAAVGIVPWGIIAFHQVGADIVGDGVSVLVRIVTLVMLAGEAVLVIAMWGRSDSPARPGGIRRRPLTAIGVSLMSLSAFAWLLMTLLISDR